jgi:thioredoxin 1
MRMNVAYALPPSRRRGRATSGRAQPTATIALTTRTFGRAVTRTGITLVNYSAPWCGPCREFDVVYGRLSRTHPDILFGKIDVDAERELAAALHITSLPTLMAFQDGAVLYDRPGGLPAQQLEDLISALAGTPGRRPTASRAVAVASDLREAEPVR